MPTTAPETSPLATSLNTTLHPPQPHEHLSKSHSITTLTLKTPPFAYLHLELITVSQNKPRLDGITARTYFSHALTQFLGLTGSAISIDILKIVKNEVWIRVPRQDCAAVVAAIGGWVEGKGVDEGEVRWRVRGKGEWLGSLVAEDDERKVWS